eukprot:COSAG06_NODE_6747_length_2799_cov_7.865926_4_plen_99_part_01
MRFFLSKEFFFATGATDGSSGGSFAPTRSSGGGWRRRRRWEGRQEVQRYKHDKATSRGRSRNATRARAEVYLAWIQRELVDAAGRRRRRRCDWAFEFDR